MNILMKIMCDVCEETTDVRLGFSNRIIQPLRYICEACTAPIDITLSLNPPKYSTEIKGGTEQIIVDRESFGQNRFIDLHLDFPTIIGKYVLGFTPFMRATTMTSKTTGVMEFSEKVSYLNFFYNKQNEVEIIIKLYHGKNKQLFKKRIEQLLDIKLNPSLKPQDINADLYLFLSSLFTPFLNTEENYIHVKNTGNLLAQLNKTSVSNFIEVLISTGFLPTIQKDSLSLYPKIYTAELALRPAIFIDQIKDYKKQKIAARISTADFNVYKDLYKDIIEVIDKQLIIITGMNNILHRGDFNSFEAMKDGKPISSLNKFSERTLAKKLEYLLETECWYPLNKESIDNNIRNGIAHYTTEYDEISQLITYYKDAKGLEKKEAEQIYFLDFMRFILESFREMHKLHHVIKAIFYYKYLIIDKPEE